jgi:WD40 repeat protein
VMTTFMPPPPAATFLAFHPQDNNIIAIGMEDSTIQIYNVRVDEVYYRVVPSLSSFAFLPAVLFSVYYVLSVQLKLGMMCLNMSACLSQVKSKLKGHQKRITGLAFSNSLNVIVSSGADAQVRSWSSTECRAQFAVLSSVFHV